MLMSRFSALFIFLFSPAITSYSLSLGEMNYDLQESDNYVRFRVAQWNIGKLNMGKPGHTSITKENREKKRIEFNKQINEVRADIFCFNEYAPYFSLMDSVLEDTLDLTRSAILSMYSDCQYGRRYGANCNCIVSSGFTRVAFKSHSYKQKKQHRYYSVCDFYIKGIVVKVVSTHLELPKHKEERDSEIEELLNKLEDSPFVIICGDFNIQDSSEYDIFVDRGYTMANHGILGDLVTYPKKNGGSPLDNIICKGFDIMGIDVYKTNLSDHYIIACDVIMK